MKKNQFPASDERSRLDHNSSGITTAAIYPTAEVVDSPLISSGTLKSHSSVADGSFSPNLLPPGAARSDDAGFRSSVSRSVQETRSRGRFSPCKLGDGDEDGVDIVMFGRGDDGYGNGDGDGSGSAGMFGREARRQDNGRLMTVFLVLSFMIGSGILNTPQAFRESGLAATTVLYFLACKSCAVHDSLSLSLLTRCEIPGTWLCYMLLIPSRYQTRK